MTFKPAIWHPIAVALSALNLVGAGFALSPPEPWHAMAHVVLAVAFGFWARRLRQGAGEAADETRLEALSDEVNSLRRELSEAQERIDFAERLLAQRPEAHRAGPPRA